METQIEEFRHRSSDTWETAYLYSQGWPIIATEVVDGTVVFDFPDGGENLRKDVTAFQSGKARAEVNLLSTAYKKVLSMVHAELRRAGR
ncbi:MAG: hypothetical protein KY429_08905 [Actinobacteria bacterium]|nr:hypothetical protein [Actinomycetota bacterium]